MTHPEQDQLRAGNADRERVVGQLNTAFAEGRLEVAELDERVAAAYAAKTIGELRPLTADLPPAGSVEPARRDARRAPAPPGSRGDVTPAADRRGAGLAVAGMGGVIAMNVLIWGIISATTHDLIYFWPVWLLIPLAFSVIRALGGHGHGGHGHGR